MANFPPSFSILSINIMLLSSSYSAAAGTDGKDSSPPSAANKSSWCVASGSASDQVLQSNLDFACPEIDCAPIQPGGTCFLPNTLVSHASYAMNSYYQIYGRNFKNCLFDGSGVIVFKDPSYDCCHYL